MAVHRNPRLVIVIDNSKKTSISFLLDPKIVLFIPSLPIDVTPKETQKKSYASQVQPRNATQFRSGQVSYTFRTLLITSCKSQSLLVVQTNELFPHVWWPSLRLLDECPKGWFHVIFECGLEFLAASLLLSSSSFFMFNLLLLILTLCRHWSFRHLVCYAEKREKWQERKRQWSIQSGTLA